MNYPTPVKIEMYKGYEIHIMPVVLNPNGKRSQNAYAFLNGEPVKASCAFDVDVEDNAEEKIKSKVDQLAD